MLHEKNPDCLLMLWSYIMDEHTFISCEKDIIALTNRELEVLNLVVFGKNNLEIAKELNVSVHTAKAHVSSIFEKMSVDGRVQAAVKAVQNGLA